MLREGKKKYDENVPRWYYCYKVNTNPCVPFLWFDAKSVRCSLSGEKSVAATQLCALVRDSTKNVLYLLLL